MKEDYVDEKACSHASWDWSGKATLVGESINP